MKKRAVRIMFILTVVFCLSFPALAMADTGNVTRLAGNDRYDTAAEIAKVGWAQFEYAVLVFGENYPDALTATPLAGKYDAPILLTRRSSLPEITKQTLSHLQVKNVIIVGGTAVVNASVEDELRAMGVNVSRVFGWDKFETAVEVAKQLDSPSEVFVVLGDDFPDALSVSSVAGIKRAPILLVSENTVPETVKKYVDSININKSYVIGSADVISDQVSGQFPNVERIFGDEDSKYATNVAVYDRFEDEGIFDPDKACVATGELFADALAGSAYAVKILAPVFLVANDPYTVSNVYVLAKQMDNSDIYVFGGTGVIPDAAILLDLVRGTSYIYSLTDDEIEEAFSEGEKGWDYVGDNILPKYEVEGVGDNLYTNYSGLLLFTQYSSIVMFCAVAAEHMDFQLGFLERMYYLSEWLSLINFTLFLAEPEYSEQPSMMIDVLQEGKKIDVVMSGLDGLPNTDISAIVSEPIDGSLYRRAGMISLKQADIDVQKPLTIKVTYADSSEIIYTLNLLDYK